MKKNFQDHYNDVFQLYKNKKLTPIITGSRPDIYDLSDYNIFLYAIGSYIEFEHTNDLLDACKIALVHYKEDEDYYHKLLSCVESVPELEEYMIPEKHDLSEIIKMAFKEVLNTDIKIVMEYFNEYESIAVMMDVSNSYFTIFKVSKSEYLLSFVKYIPQTYETPEDWDIKDVKKSANFLEILDYMMKYYFDEASGNFYSNMGE